MQSPLLYQKREPPLEGAPGHLLDQSGMDVLQRTGPIDASHRLKKWRKVGLWNDFRHEAYVAQKATMRHIKHKMAAQSPILRHFTGFIRRKLGTIDNRSSHFYLCLYWAQALAEQTADAALATTLKPIAEKLATAEKQIVQELLAVQEHLSRRSFSEGRPDGDDRTGSGCGC